jgi:pimeloyl-ACP methyl ester carboxylesterase
VTLVHGVGANLQSWDEVTARLTPHFTVVRLDLRGPWPVEPNHDLHARGSRRRCAPGLGRARHPPKAISRASRSAA